MLVLVTVFSLSTLVVGARQTPAPAAPPVTTTNAVGPKIAFDLIQYDFGRVKSGDPVKHTYVFTNTGDALLVLNNVQPQCGCTAAGEWTKQVPPGKTGVIPIQFNTAAYNGGVLKQITVTCNVTNQPMLFLQLKGTVYRPYDVNPQMAVFTLPPDSESASMVLTVTNNMEEPLLISGLQVNNPIFRAELVTNVLGKGYQVKLTTVPPLPPMGSPQGLLTLKTSWTNTPIISVTLIANIQPAVMVNPPAIMLPPGPLRTGITNSIMIQNNYGTNALTLSEPAINVPGVGIEIREHLPGRSYSAMVGFPPGFEIPPSQQVEFSIKTSSPKVPVVKVPVRQMARPVVPVPPKPAQAMAPVPTPPPSFPLVPPGTPPVPVCQAPSTASTPPPPPPPPPPLPPGL